MADKVTKRVVCLGGGRGTSSLLQGLKEHTDKITVVTSMADDGGSSGRLRKTYNIMPPGDIVSCIAALIPDRELSALLTHRFPGKHKTSKEISGHKLGNLMMLAEMQRTGDFYKALEVMKHIFNVKAEIFPATEERTRLSAFTLDGRRLHSETTLTLAKYAEPYGLKKVYITPKNPQVNPKILQNMKDADLIISGPGDLYTNQLPVLLIPQISQALMKSKAKKLFVLNVANKPFETKGYSLKDFVQAFIYHLGTFPFDTVLVNNNRQIPIPKKYKYTYIKVDDDPQWKFEIISDDLVNPQFPIYHQPEKLGDSVARIMNQLNTH